MSDDERRMNRKIASSSVPTDVPETRWWNYAVPASMF
jgi:hypothetical protein